MVYEIEECASPNDHNRSETVIVSRDLQALYPTLSYEFIVRGDTTSVVYREWLLEFDRKFGLGIDLDVVHNLSPRSDVSFTDEELIRFVTEDLQVLVPHYRELRIDIVAEIAKEIALSYMS